MTPGSERISRNSRVPERKFPESLLAEKNLQNFSRFAFAVTKRVTAIGMIAFAIGSGLAWMDSLRTTVMDWRMGCPR